MYKLLITVRAGGPDGSSVHQAVVEFTTQAEAEVAFEAISLAGASLFSREIIKLY